MNPKPSFRYDPDPGVEPLFDNDQIELSDRAISLMSWVDRQPPVICETLWAALFLLALVSLPLVDLWLEIRSEHP